MALISKEGRAALDRLARLERDLMMMRSCLDWPRWPLLPVKLRDGDFQDPQFCGLLFADGQPIVYLGNLFHLPGANGETWRQVMNAMQRREYPTLHALAADYTVD
jgi:hypothetical protein